MHILLVEPDQTTASSVKLMMARANLNVYCTDHAEEANDFAKLYDYDLIISETILPDGSGLDVLRKLRIESVETPFMFLSADDSTETKITAFGYGADDYMTKPFHREELIARINAVIRRSKGHSQSVIRTGEIAVNLDNHVVTVSGKLLHLSKKEYKILEILSLRKGTTITKEMFMNHLYNGMDEPELKIIDIYISKLRKKLVAAGVGNHHIETIWGRGYVMRD